MIPFSSILETEYKCYFHSTNVLIFISLAMFVSQISLNLKSKNMFGDILQLLVDWESVIERVPEGLSEHHPPVRLVLQHPGDQVEHDALVLAHRGVRGVPPVLGQGPAVLAGVPRGGLRPVPGQPRGPRLEEAGLSSSDNVGREVSEYSVHHGQVLQVIVGLEQCVPLKWNGKLRVADNIHHI